MNISPRNADIDPTKAASVELPAGTITIPPSGSTQVKVGQMMLTRGLGGDEGGG